MKEGRVSVGRSPPKTPTTAEREEHARTHSPYRNWCEHCAKPRARNAPHRKNGAEDQLDEVTVPRVHRDYFFMSKDDEKASKNPLIVVAGDRAGSRNARAVGRKGTGEDGAMGWLIEDIGSILKSWGRAGGRGGVLVMKSDGEPAIVALGDAVMKYHGGIVIPERPAMGERADHGMI